jgi:hypothetical protein
MSDEAVSEQAAHDDARGSTATEETARAKVAAKFIDILAALTSKMDGDDGKDETPIPPGARPWPFAEDGLLGVPENPAETGYHWLYGLQNILVVGCWEPRTIYALGGWRLWLPNGKVVKNADTGPIGEHMQYGGPIAPPQPFAGQPGPKSPETF